MIILGWLVLTGLAAWVTFGGLICLYAGLGFSGKIGAEAWIFLVIGAGLFYASYCNFPFVMVMK